MLFALIPAFGFAAGAVMVATHTISEHAVVAVVLSVAAAFFAVFAAREHGVVY